MWKFSYLNSGYNLRPPDVGQQQLSPDSLVFPTYTSTTIGCFTSNSITPLPGLGVQGSSLNLISEFILPLNSQVFKPASGSSRLNASTPAKRFLVYDHSGDQRSLIFSSVNNPFQALNPTLPSRNASYAFASNSHANNKHEEMHEDTEEMHEDTEEIDALLYSDSEFSFDSEEASTGHSPLNMKEEEAMVSIPPKRRKLDLNHSSIDESLIDTASSARASNFQEIPSDDDADMSYVDSGSNLDDESRDESCKQFQTVVKALRRIIPGGDTMDTASVLDEAIRYLKSLKPQANFLHATTASI